MVGASYGGDASYLGSTSATFTQTVGSALRATTTVVTSNRNPAANLGQNVTFTATVRPVTGTGIPAGTRPVQHRRRQRRWRRGTERAGQGDASPPTRLSAGSHNVIATYSGSAIFAGGGSATFVQAVNQAASTTTLTSNRNPSVFGQSVTFTARVTAAGGGGGEHRHVHRRRRRVGSPVALDATGRAPLVTTTLAVGTHTVSAAYGGSANYLPSTSATLTKR